LQLINDRKDCQKLQLVPYLINLLGISFYTQIRRSDRQVRSPFLLGVILLSHGRLDMNNNTIWADINSIDRVLSSIISFVYTVELCLQTGFILYFLFFTPDITDSVVIAPITEHTYIVFSVVSWIAEVFVVMTIGTTDLQQLETLDITLSFNRMLIGVQYFNLWLFQGMLCVIGLYYSEHSKAQNEFVRLVMVYNIVKVAQYFVFFVIWLWCYLCRVLPCCHHFTRHIFDFFRNMKLRRFLKNRVRDAGFDPSDSCPICIKDLGDGETVIALPCEHYYHRTCIRTWLEISSTCPMCKSRVNTASETTPLLQQL